MTRIDRAIEKSSLGTRAARAARQTVPRANATRIVDASRAVERKERPSWGKAEGSAPIPRRGRSNET